MSDKIYLAKEGKTHGPFTPEEFERIRSSGEITSYDAISDSRTGGAWEPLDLPPAPAPLPAQRKTPPPAPAASSKTETSRGERQTPPTPSAALRVRAIEAVCHNYRSVVAGRLSRVTETGCDLISGHSDAGPCFAERGQVFLNLLDPATGQAMDVTAHLISVTRTSDGGWSYRLEWPTCPGIVLAA